jgi:F-type H+-transporting ATPase subunit delta
VAMAIANRYARALADVVSRTGDYRKILGELEDFGAAYRESADLREVLKTPAVPLVEKTKVLEAILSRLETSTAASNFLRVLLAHYRLDLLEEVVQAYTKLVNERLGVVQVRISSATELPEIEQRALRERFEKLTQKKVEVRFRIERDLLGGILAQVESTVYDGSVRGHLQRIRERLMAR